MITIEDITAALAEAVRTSPHNYVSEQMALVPEDVGKRLYDDPIIAIGSADDPLWDKLKEPQAVGAIFRTPKQWMPQGRCVVSYFAPFSDYVVEGNRADNVLVGNGWLYARVEGQAFLTEMNHFLEQWGREPSMEELEQCTGMKRTEIVMAMEASMEVESIYKNVYQTDGKEIPLLDKLRDEKNQQEELMNHLLVEQLLQQLNEREQNIIRLRYYENVTQTEVAKQMGLSQVQVSRLEKRILLFLKSKVEQ